MAEIESYDGVSWNALATQPYVNQFFRPATGYYTNNLTTQTLTANTWVKLGGNITTAFSLGFPVDLSPTGGTTNRITKLDSLTSGSWYKADATAVVRSSAGGSARLSLQIVKNGILSSVVPRSSFTGVFAANVDLGLSIDTSYIQLVANDYIEVYISCTNATTLTLVDLTFNAMRVS